MKKSILNLEGAQELTRKEQKSVNGGRVLCFPDITHPEGYPCPPNQCCVQGRCILSIPGEPC